MTSIRHYTIILYALLSTFAGMLGCRDDVSDFRPYPASVGEIRLTLAQVPDPSTHSVFYFDGLDHDTILTTAGGVRVFLTDTDQLFQDESGTSVPCSSCADLKVEITEVIRKGDILARELPSTTTNKQPLASVAIVNLKISCENRTLKLLDDRYVKVQVPSAELKPDLSLWLGETVDEELLGWIAGSNGSGSVYWAEWPTNTTATQTGYELITKKLGWLNAAAPIDEQTTQFCVTLPPGFDAENSQVYVLLKNNRSVFALQPGADFGQFCLDDAPVGFPVQLVTLTKLGDQFLLGNAQSEIGTNGSVKVDPQDASESEVIQFIRNL